MHNTKSTRDVTVYNNIARARNGNWYQSKTNINIITEPSFVFVHTWLQVKERTAAHSPSPSHGAKCAGVIHMIYKIILFRYLTYHLTILSQLQGLLSFIWVLTELIKNHQPSTPHLTEPLTKTVTRSSFLDTFGIFNKLRST